MIDARPPRRRSAPAPLQWATTLLLTILMGSALVGPAAGATSTAVSSPAPAAAASSATAASSTATTVTPDTATAAAMAAQVLSLLNHDRVAVGLRPLRAWTNLQIIADQRSASMAATKVLTHSPNAGSVMTSFGLPWYSWGENVGWTSYPWGSSAAASLYSMWYHSAPHHAIMFSNTYNYVGIGIARAADGSTWSSALFSESPDHTRPWARNGSLTVSGTTLRFSWSGGDVLLQTHTAGLRGYNLLYRVDNGSWHQIRTLTLSTSVTYYNRVRGHYYSFRVQSADRRGNLSAWTAAKRIWIP